jgi:hypothetical protein
MSLPKQELFDRIRRDNWQRQLSIRDLSRKYGVHRRLVREALSSPVPTPRRRPVRTSPRMEQDLHRSAALRGDRGPAHLQRRHHRDNAAIIETGTESPSHIAWLAPKPRRTQPQDTRAGTVELAIPKLRQGSYYPHWLLERRRRAEQALISVVATAYLLGVSTRRVEKLAESLGVTQLSKSQVSAMARHLDESEAMVHLAMINLMTCRLTGESTPTWRGA